MTKDFIWDPLSPRTASNVAPDRKVLAIAGSTLRDERSHLVSIIYEIGSIISLGCSVALCPLVVKCPLKPIAHSVLSEQISAGCSMELSGLLRHFSTLQHIAVWPMSLGLQAAILSMWLSRMLSKLRSLPSRANAWLLLFIDW